MVRRSLSGEIWKELQVIMRETGCKSSKNSHDVIEAILHTLLKLI